MNAHIETCDGAQFNFDKLDTTVGSIPGNYLKKRFSWHSVLGVVAKRQ